MPDGLSAKAESRKYPIFYGSLWAFSSDLRVLIGSYHVSWITTRGSYPLLIKVVFG